MRRIDAGADAAIDLAPNPVSAADRCSAVHSFSCRSSAINRACPRRRLHRCIASTSRRCPPDQRIAAQPALPRRLCSRRRRTEHLAGIGPLVLAWHARRQCAASDRQRAGRALGQRRDRPGSEGGTPAAASTALMVVALVSSIAVLSAWWLRNALQPYAHTAATTASPVAALKWRRDQLLPLAVIAALTLTLPTLTKLAPYLAQLRTGPSARLLVCSSACLHVCMSACLHEIVSHHVELDACDSTRLMRSNMCTANSSVSKRALRLPHGQRRCATDTVEGIVIDDFDDLGCISSQPLKAI
ncbi:membrane protein [Xanthomonas arboricola pv. fragariae]|nr:membrane protein [Xanthomonas arboricola pv. fragariae]